MRETTTRALGFALAVAYAVFIVWLFVRPPQTMAQVIGGLSAAIGTYAVDGPGHRRPAGSFRHDQFVKARMAFARTIATLGPSRG